MAQMNAKCSKKTRKENNKDLYPRVCFRVSKSSLERMESLRELAGLKFGQVVNACLNSHLPVLMKNHGIK